MLSTEFSVLTLAKPICLFLYLTQQTFLVSRDVFKTSRRLQHNAFRLPRPLEDVFKTSCKTSSKMSSRRVCKCLAIMSSRRLQDVLKTKKCYTEDVFMTSSVHLHQNECLLGKYVNSNCIDAQKTSLGKSEAPLRGRRCAFLFVVAIPSSGSFYLV